MGMNQNIPTILLVDENAARRQKLTSRLRTNPTINYKIEAGLGGFHTVHMLENEDDFDLVILVEEFNDMPVHELLMMIRGPLDSRVPVLYLSQNDNLVKFKNFFNLGASSCEVITENFNELLQSIAKLLPKSK